jgi:hypothetical protein
MSPSEQRPADAKPEYEPQLARFGRMRTWLPMIAVSLVVVALVAVLLVRAGAGGTSASQPGGRGVVPANWHTFHDKLGLYTLRLPPGWTAQGGVGVGPTEGNSSVSVTLTIEGFHFTDPSQGTGSAEVYIAAYPLNAADRQFMCATTSQTSYPPFNGLQGIGSRSLYLFGTENAQFQIDVTIPGILVPVNFGPPPPAATPLPASWIATDQTDVHGILATFQPTDSKALAC